MIPILYHKQMLVFLYNFSQTCINSFMDGWRAGYIYIGRVSFTRACSYSHLCISRFKVYMTGRNVYRQSI